MDFHTLSRRDLQALCKKNKIPANISNAAMANALQAIQTVVEGIDEIFVSPNKPAAAQEELRESQGSPLPRSRRVTAKTVEVVSDQEEKQEDQEPEPKPPATGNGRKTTRATRARVVKDEEETLDTPASRTGRKTRGAETAKSQKKAVRYDDGEGGEAAAEPPRTGRRIAARRAAAAAAPAPAPAAAVQEKEETVVPIVADEEEKKEDQEPEPKPPATGKTIRATRRRAVKNEEETGAKEEETLDTPASRTGRKTRGAETVKSQKKAIENDSEDAGGEAPAELPRTGRRTVARRAAAATHAAAVQEKEEKVVGPTAQRRGRQSSRKPTEDPPASAANPGRRSTRGRAAAAAKPAAFDQEKEEPEEKEIAIEEKNQESDESMQIKPFDLMSSFSNITGDVLPNQEGKEEEPSKDIAGDDDAPEKKENLDKPTEIKSSCLQIEANVEVEEEAISLSVDSPILGVVEVAQFPAGVEVSGEVEPSGSAGGDIEFNLVQSPINAEAEESGAEGEAKESELLEEVKEFGVAVEVKASEKSVLEVASVNAAAPAGSDVLVTGDEESSGEVEANVGQLLEEVKELGAAVEVKSPEKSVLEVASVDAAAPAGSDLLVAGEEESGGEVEANVGQLLEEVKELGAAEVKSPEKSALDIASPEKSVLDIAWPEKSVLGIASAVEEGDAEIEESGGEAESKEVELLDIASADVAVGVVEEGDAEIEESGDEVEAKEGELLEEVKELSVAVEAMSSEKSVLDIASAEIEESGNEVKANEGELLEEVKELGVAGEVKDKAAEKPVLDIVSADVAVVGVVEEGDAETEESGDEAESEEVVLLEQQVEELGVTVEVNVEVKAPERSVLVVASADVAVSSAGDGGEAEEGEFVCNQVEAGSLEVEIETEAASPAKIGINNVPMTVDNKENELGREEKPKPMRDDDGGVHYSRLSMRKLKAMYKEKLITTNNKVVEEKRSALSVLNENCVV